MFMIIHVRNAEKILKKRGRKPKEASVDDNCRFCDCNLTAHTAGSKTSFENLFKPSRNLILAETCESIGFKLQCSETLSERVCRPCGRKIRNTRNGEKEAVEGDTERLEFSSSPEHRCYCGR